MQKSEKALFEAPSEGQLLLGVCIFFSDFSLCPGVKLLKKSEITTTLFKEPIILRDNSKCK